MEVGLTRASAMFAPDCLAVLAGDRGWFARHLPSRALLTSSGLVVRGVPSSRSALQGSEVDGRRVMDAREGAAWRMKMKSLQCTYRISAPHIILTCTSVDLCSTRWPHLAKIGRRCRTSGKVDCKCSRYLLARPTDPLCHVRSGFGEARCGSVEHAVP